VNGGLDRAKQNALEALGEYAEALRARIRQLDEAIREIGGPPAGGGDDARPTSRGRRDDRAADRRSRRPPPHTTATAGPPAPASPRRP
jgi:hypothetical protein